MQLCDPLKNDISDPVYRPIPTPKGPIVTNQSFIPVMNAPVVHLSAILTTLDPVGTCGAPFRAISDPFPTSNVAGGDFTTLDSAAYPINP